MRLTVTNFQIHKSNTVEIPEGQTTYLEGDSDTGKSAMLRALRWLCENKPDGGSFVTFKQPRGTNARAVLETDGRHVIRERGKSTNLYKLDGETFEAFGRSVPEPVEQFLKLSPFAFQLQGEVPFLIGNSPTEAAKILSDACGLGVIDTAVGVVRGKKTTVEADIRKGEILLESAQKRLADSERYLPAAGALEHAAEVGVAFEQLVARCQGLAAALDAEPLGQALDIEATRQRAATAHAAQGAVIDLLARVQSLRTAVGAEPVGVLKDVEGARSKASEARVLSDWLADVGRSLSEMRAILAAEPQGRVIDTEAAHRALARAKILDTERQPLVTMVGAVRQALSVEPRGAAMDVSTAACALAKARALGGELTVLEGLRAEMQKALRAEPVGTLLDTSELLKQRAQIKVCPTCGREL